MTQGTPLGDVERNELLLLRDQVDTLRRDITRVTEERDGYRAKLAEQTKKLEDDETGVRLELQAHKLSTQIEEKFWSRLQQIAWICTLVLSLATLGGYFSLSHLVDEVVQKEVEKRDKDIVKLRDNVIQSVADFRVESEKALQDIRSLKADVESEKGQAVIAIRRSAQSLSTDSEGLAGSSTITTPLPSYDSINNPVTIPVVVHVVYATSAENISDDQVRSAIAALNRDFRAKNTDLAQVPEPFRKLVGDAHIEFVLADRDPNGRTTTGVTRTQTKRALFGTDNSVKRSATGGVDAWDAERYLNVWVANLDDGQLDYAQFPGGPKETDGIVVTPKAFGTLGTAEAPYDLGRTTTHAIGLYLGLRHIWGDATGCNGNDYVSDTPNQAGPNFGKPQFPHVTCGNGPNGDMFMNFMDYVDDDAMYMFTKGQVQRMQQTLQGLRRKLVRQ